MKNNENGPTTEQKWAEVDEIVERVERRIQRNEVPYCTCGMEEYVYRTFGNGNLKEDV